MRRFFVFLLLVLAAEAWMWDHPAPVSAQGVPVIVGRGKTTLYAIDADGDGCGTGVMKNGGYVTNGLNGNVQSQPLIEPNGDSPDADDSDPTVCDTVSWEAKWGKGNVGICAFLLATDGFTNCSRVFYLSNTVGNDATAQPNHDELPYRTTDAILAITRDWQGGVIATRKGEYTDWNLASRGGSVQASGSLGHTLAVIAYPGERVVITASYAASINKVYAPGKQTGYMLIRGLIFRTPTFGVGNPIDAGGWINTTIEDCEFLGGHQLSFADHTVGLHFRRNVGHQMGTHFFYLMSATYTTYFGEQDFPFDQEQARWANAGGLGVAEDIWVEDNISYNNGYSGYEPWHCNTNARWIHFRRNITSYSGGMGISLQTGIYDSDLIGNLFVDNADSAFGMYTYETVGAKVTPSKIRRILIQNNTSYNTRSIANGATVTIRGHQINGCVTAADGTQGVASPTDQHPILDITFRNNVCVVDNWSAQSGPAPLDLRKNSHPETWIVENNRFFSNSPTSNPLTDVVMRISPDVTGSDTISTRYTFAQTQAFGWLSFTGNTYGNPGFVAADPTWTLTPQFFNLRPIATSPLIGAASLVGAPPVDIAGSPFAGTIGAYQSGSKQAVPPAGRQFSGNVTTSGRGQ